jgi:WD40 repeat protein
LRKTDQTIPIVHPEGSKTTNVAFDFYGNYLLTTAGQSLNVFPVKQWETPAVTLNPHGAKINVAKFAPSGNYIVSGGEDRFLKIFSF